MTRASSASRAGAAVPVACAGWQRPPTSRSGRPSSTTGSPSGRSTGAATDRRWCCCTRTGSAPGCSTRSPGSCATTTARSGSTCGVTARATPRRPTRSAGSWPPPATWSPCSTRSASTRWSLLGESLGGGTGILVDRLRPGLVRRLLLCEAIAMPPVGGLPGAERREPHVGDGPPPAGGVGRPRHRARVVRQPSAAERDRARRARRLRALGVPRPARRPGRARVPARGRGVVLRVRDPARRRAGVVRASGRRCRGGHDRRRRRHRPARRHVRGAGRAGGRRSPHGAAARTSSCRRTRRAPPPSCASTLPGEPSHAQRLRAPTRSRPCRRWCGRPRRRTRTRRGRL